MRKHVLVLTATTAILACGAIAAIAQAPGAEAQPTPGGPGGMMGMPGMMRDHLGIMGGHPGIMGMMGRDYGHHGSVMARIIFSLMDADGDGKLTLQEWQAAHERIFKAMDTNHDGTVPSRKWRLSCTALAGRLLRGKSQVCNSCVSVAHDVVVQLQFGRPGRGEADEY